MSTRDDPQERDVSLLASDQYMRYVKWTPEVTREEEAQLVQQVARGKAERGKASPDAQVLQQAQHARDRLVDGFQSFLIFVAKPYLRWSRSMELPDLTQEGTIGLLHAIERYDATRGYPLVTFAGWWVRAAIRAALADGDGMVRVPEKLGRLLRKLGRAQEQLLGVLGREPSPTELAEAMQVGEDKVCDLLALRACEQVSSLEAILEVDEVQDWGFVSLFAAAQAAETARQEELARQLREAIDTALSPRQRQVIHLRYGLDAETTQMRTYRAVGQMLGRVEHGIVGTETRAKARLRRALAGVYADARSGEVV